MKDPANNWLVEQNKIQQNKQNKNKLAKLLPSIFLCSVERNYQVQRKWQEGRDATSHLFLIQLMHGQISLVS